MDDKWFDARKAGGKFLLGIEDAVTPGGSVEICCLPGHEEALRRRGSGLARLRAGQEG